MDVNTDTRKQVVLMGGADGTGPTFYPKAVLFYKTAATNKCICEVLECNSEF
jgi:hypothetical protein